MGSATYDKRLNEMLQLGGSEREKTYNAMRDEQPSQTSAMIAQLDYRNFVAQSPMEGSQGDFGGMDSRRFFQDTGNHIMKEKENFNNKNVDAQPTLEEYVQQVNQPRVPMSLAQRAAQAKLKTLKANMKPEEPADNYRQSFKPQLPNSQRTHDQTMPQPSPVYNNQKPQFAT